MDEPKVAPAQPSGGQGVDREDHDDGRGLGGPVQHDQHGARDGGGAEGEEDEHPGQRVRVRPHLDLRVDEEEAHDDQDGEEHVEAHALGPAGDDDDEDVPLGAVDRLPVRGVPLVASKQPPPLQDDLLLVDPFPVVLHHADRHGGDHRGPEHDGEDPEHLHKGGRGQT